MRSGPVKHDSTAQDAIDQEPVRVQMAFGETGEIALQRMLSESIGQRFSRLKQRENVFEGIAIEDVSGELSLQAAEIRSKRRVKTISFTAA